MSEAQRIAEDAIFELSVVRITLEQMYALFEAVKPHVCEGSSARRLVELGIFTAESIASNAGSAEETLEARLQTLSAPQNAVEPKRGAEKDSPGLSLTEFAKGRQIAAAEQLGITQQALNTALKLGREILVTVNPDGTASGVETKPFPSVNRRKRQ